MYKYLLISFLFLYMVVVTVDMDLEITSKEMEEEHCVIKNLFSMITIVKFNFPFYYRSFDGLFLFKLEIHSEFKAYLVRTITYIQVTFSSKNVKYLKFDRQIISKSHGFKSNLFIFNKNCFEISRNISWLNFLYFTYFLLSHN